jgi:ketopantoate hydroxymethyltransferase
VRRYGDVASVITGAAAAFKKDVESGSYPNDSESYHLPSETQEALAAIAERQRK